MRGIQLPEGGSTFLGRGRFERPVLIAEEIVFGGVAGRWDRDSAIQKIFLKEMPATLGRY